MHTSAIPAHNFARIPSTNIKRSKFNRSRCYKTTLQPDVLVPFFFDELDPADTISGISRKLLRITSALVTPVMDNLHLDTFFFVVPKRLLWDDYTKMHGERIDPDDSIDFTVPQISSSTGFKVHGIADYLSWPVNVAGFKRSALWHRAYWFIVNEFFRDQNLQDSFKFARDGVDVDVDNFTNFDIDVPFIRAKPHDYFTSCLPFAQKGPGVEIPLGNLGTGYFTQAVGPTGTGSAIIHGLQGFPNSWAYLQSNAGAAALAANTIAADGPGSTVSGFPQLVSLGTAAYPLQPNGFSVEATTINSLREAFQIQKLLERDARGGTRYTELLRSHFGVVNPDFRLQRPEYIGGSSDVMSVTPVMQTSASDSTTPQGNLAAYGVMHRRSGGFHYSATEYCVIIGLVNIWSDITYQQGCERMFARKSRYDEYYPEFAHLGEQAVLSSEIYVDGSANDDDVFGYQERYAEKRYGIGHITGKLRSGLSDSIDHWTLSQHFANRPVLSSEFIQQSMPLARVVAVDPATEPPFILDVWHEVSHVRALPVYSVPGLVDHF